MRILVVEDETRLAQTLRDLLHREGYTVDVCYSGTEGLDNALSGIYDLMLLDVMLPGLDGFTVLERLRGSGSRLPVLMLTARGELSDRVHGLDRGADYYLTKPFQSDLQLQPGSFQVCCQERSARLSRKEYDLLEMLMRNGGQILSKEQLLLKAWGYDSDAEDNNVEVYISFLRRKLALIRSAVQIKTVRMVGYYLEEAK